MSGYCSGIALNEIAERTEPERGDGEGLAPRFPSVAGVMAWLEPKHDADVFRFGLDILLDALAKEAPSGARRRR